MSNAESNVHFWNHILATAELIEGLEAHEAQTVVMEQLSTISEAFADGADPVESFEEYVVIKLSQAIHSALARTLLLNQALEENSSQAPGTPT